MMGIEAAEEEKMPYALAVSVVSPSGNIEWLRMSINNDSMTSSFWLTTTTTTVMTSIQNRFHNLFCRRHCCCC